MPGPPATLWMRQLRRKKVTLKRLMLSSIEAAKEKLKKYYGETDDIEGNLHAIGTILAPSSKMEFFSTSDWDLNPEIVKNYRKEYSETLQYHQRIYLDLLERSSEGIPYPHSQQSPLESGLRLILTMRKTLRPMNLRIQMRIFDVFGVGILPRAASNNMAVGIITTDNTIEPSMVLDRRNEEVTIQR
ncbi:hypothetical protein PENFLA_c010G11063 [Penicillium flavigenum]|uniref:Uncharacterized protein n=1 Tax=Penicillium flavigenum TaxID=254877 RepID=A0A1V6TCM5_9EURO|nr:hypothetical protein PENFLA_c010G11063 [Penicillium flavigenum]